MASKIEAISRRQNFGSGLETKTVFGKSLVSRRGSEADAGKVAVAIRDLGALHQQPVDGRHQAAEQGAGGRQYNGSSLGHCVPFLGGQPSAASSSGNNLCIPDAKDNVFVCIAAICRLQCSIIGKLTISDNEEGRRKPAALASSSQNGTRSIPRPASAADRARRNRGFRRPGGR
jgi:hypothetical protein